MQHDWAAIAVLVTYSTNAELVWVETIVMKAGIAPREFAARYLELCRLMRHSKRKFQKALDALLEKVKCPGQFEILLQLTSHFVGKKLASAKQAVVQSWEAVMAARVAKIELRKPVCARLDWIEQNAEEYRRVIFACAPESRVAQGLVALLVAAGCPLVPF